MAAGSKTPGSCWQDPAEEPGLHADEVGARGGFATKGRHAQICTWARSLWGHVGRAL